MIAIDLNSDLGEGFGPFRVGADDDFSASSPARTLPAAPTAATRTIMEQTIRKARAHGVAVGAHPGFPDRAGFGRRAMAMTPAEIRVEVIFQVGALAAFCQVGPGAPAAREGPRRPL